MLNNLTRKKDIRTFSVSLENPSGKRAMYIQLYFSY